jgi:hypothetical protein
VVIIFISYRVPKGCPDDVRKCEAGWDYYCWAISLMYPDSGYYIRAPTRPTPHICEQPGQKPKVRRPLVADVRQFVTFAQPASVS